MATANLSNLQPYIEIMFQPALNYALESENTKNNPNFLVSDQKEKKNKKLVLSVPKIKIVDPQKRGGQLVVTCVSSTPNRDLKYHVHPNKLIGNSCRSNVGVYQFAPGQEIIEISNLCIRKTLKENINQSIANLEKLKIDPYKAGFEFNKELINLDQFRLSFQAFLRDKITPTDIKKMVFTSPVVSNIIYNNTGTKIIIDYVDINSDFQSGGAKITIIMQNLKTYMDNNSKKELKVLFFEPNWQAHGNVEFIYNNCTVVCLVPKYDNKITKERYVSLQVIVTDQNVSEPILSDIQIFTYKPVVEPTKCPIAYDEYYECEIQDSKNAIEINKNTREKLAERTKSIWAIYKSRAIEINKNEYVTIDLRLPNDAQDNNNKKTLSKMDCIGNNYVIKYTNNDNLHFLYPNLERIDDIEKAEINLLDILISTNIDLKKRITHPTTESNENNLDNFDNNFNSNDDNNNSNLASNIDTNLYNIEEIIDLIHDT